jgi:hypothetical protein
MAAPAVHLLTKEGVMADSMPVIEVGDWILYGPVLEHGEETYKFTCWDGRRYPMAREFRRLVVEIRKRDGRAWRKGE